MQSVNCIWGILDEKWPHLYDDFLEIVREKFPMVQVVYSNWDIDLTRACEAVWPGASRGTWYCYSKVNF